MTPDRCSRCDLLFPLDVWSDVRIASYCGTISHWKQADIDMELCLQNVAYLLGTFVPMTDEERADDADTRRMLNWLDERSIP